MGTDIYDGPLGEVRAASTASGGTALSTTATLIPLPKGTDLITLTPRNFSTAIVARWLKNPFLVVLVTQDGGVTFRDISDVVQDATDSGTADLSSLSTLVAGDAIYVGSHLPFRGVRVDVTNANGNPSVLTVTFWDGTTWTSITATDGSDSGGATFAVDGNVTWTVPTGWASELLSKILGIPVNRSSALGEKLYWTRWVVSAALDSAVSVANLLALNRSTAYAELVVGQGWQERIHWGREGVGCIEALTDAGTANLVVNAAALSTGGRLP